jgi:hypothetical protein
MAVTDVPIVILLGLAILPWPYAPRSIAGVMGMVGIIGLGGEVVAAE